MKIVVHSSRPAQVARYVIPSAVITAVLTHLQNYAGLGCEAVAFCAGCCDGGTATVSKLWIPRFEATSISYDVSPQEMLRFSAVLRAESLTFLAQIHSHPGTAFHSGRDDVMAASPEVGFVSVVVPNGGSVSGPFFEAVEVFEHAGNGRWRRIAQSEKAKRFEVL